VDPVVASSGPEYCAREDSLERAHLPCAFSRPALGQLGGRYCRLPHAPDSSAGCHGGVTRHTAGLATMGFQIALATRIPQSLERAGPPRRIEARRQWRRAGRVAASRRTPARSRWRRHRTRRASPTPPMPVDAPAECRRSPVVPQQPERWKCEAGEQHRCGGCALSGNEQIGGTASASGNQGPPTLPEGGHGPAARTRTRRRCFRRLAPSRRWGPRCARMHSRL